MFQSIESVDGFYQYIVENNSGIYPKQLQYRDEDRRLKHSFAIIHTEDNYFVLFYFLGKLKETYQTFHVAAGLLWMLQYEVEYIYEGFLQFQQFF